MLGNNMFTYCLNNPVAYSDSRGTDAKVCIAADGTIDEIPWWDHSPGGGGYVRYYGSYSGASQMHWENSWVDTDKPTFLSLTNEGLELASWDLSIYGGSLFFDETQEQSVYVSAGNLGVYAGAHYENGIGFSGGGSVISLGYDGVFLDCSIEFITAEAACMYKDGKLSNKFGLGFIGVGWSIDFAAIYSYWFGG